LIPSSAALARPVLEALADGRERSTRELWEQLCVACKLSTEEIAEKTDKGKFRFYGRIQWARTHLKEQGLIAYTGTSRCKITDAGVAQLASGPSETNSGRGCEGPHQSAARVGATEESGAFGGTLESELRHALGSAVKSDDDWHAICLLNGWSAAGVHSYPEVAKITGRPTDELLAVARRCKHKEGQPAPLLDAALAIASAHPNVTPDELSMILGGYGLVETTFSIAGLAEGARRFGRTAEWERLVRYLADSHARNVHDFVRSPRPFESWFEVDVFTVLRDAGLRVEPQVHIGGYRADLVLPDVNPKVIVECDGEKWHTGQRADGDRTREHELLNRRYSVVRVSGDRWHQDRIRAAIVLLDTLEMMNVIPARIA